MTPEGKPKLLATGFQGVEMKTLGVLLGCYLVWGGAGYFLMPAWPMLAFVLIAFCVALHASLQHEAIHGHPTKHQWLNELLVFPSLGLFVPFRRFRDTHIAHHLDARLTDPFDDPESNYLDPDVWQSLSRPVRAVLMFNNTLLGRVLIGVLVSQVVFMAQDINELRRGNRSVLRGWILHIPAVAIVVLWVWFIDMAVWTYILAAYLGNALVKIRTFAEHQAHELADARTVIIEDCGPLAFLFLNNNLHAVHHDRPGIAWYDLPAHYAANRDTYLKANDGYSYHCYRDVFARYFFRRKDPVAHPLWRTAEHTQTPVEQGRP